MNALEKESTPFTRIPDELQSLPQWVNWRPDADSKVPLNPQTLRNAGVTWPETWGDFQLAREVAVEQSTGMGFVLTQEDPYTCVDLDDCVGPRGQIDSRTREILDLLSGWVELSPSNTGLHIWIRNDEPVSRRVRGLEIYSYARWITVTGRSNPHCPLEIPNRTAELAELMDRLMPQSEGPPFSLSTAPPTLSDQEIWDQLFHAPSGSFFQSLYEGDISVCHGDHSRAVIMLANQLALMTNFDPQRIKQLLHQTRLLNEKWHEKRGSATWTDYQIQDAIAYVSGRQ